MTGLISGCIKKKKSKLVNFCAAILILKMVATFSTYYALLFLFYINFKNFWLRWVFVAARGLSLWTAGATLRCDVRASPCSGFSCCRTRALGAWTSVVVAHGL